MRKVLSGVLMLGFILALGVYGADAQSQPPGGTGGGVSARCADIMGPGMMGGPMRGGYGMRGKGMMAPGMASGNMGGRCGCGMASGNMEGRCGCGMASGNMEGRCGCGMASGNMEGRCGCGMMGRHFGMMGGKGSMGGVHHRLWHYIMRLDLDQNQRAEIWKTKTDLMKNMIRKKADLRIAMLELGNLVHADKTDMKKVEAKVKQIENLRSSMLISGIEAMEAVKSKLTADQRKKLGNMMESPGRCMMMGDDMMSGGMTGGDMMGDGMMEEAPAED
jgi:Spy/CpxP family protein refolding chaperone